MKYTKNRIIVTILFALYFFLPVHVLWYYYSPAWYPIRSYLNSIPLTLILLIPAFLCGNIAKIWIIIFYCVFLVSEICSGMHLLFYQTTISSHSFFAIFETSIEEASEFIYSQFTVFSFIYLVSLVFIPSFLIYYLLHMKFLFEKKDKIAVICIFFMVSILGLIFGPCRLVRDHQGWNMISSLINYYSIKKSLAEYMQKSKSIIIPGVEDALAGKSRTLVVAIGESSNRHHWSLYGYFRPTTPKLEALRSELLVFNDVISPFSNTTESVACALSFADLHGNDRVPLINIFRQAGFETVWISNQSTIDSFNSIVQMVSGADQQIYLNKGGDQGYLRAYDENLLPALKKVLHTPAPNGKRVIFLHMMGSHVNYASRIPENFCNFSSFNDIPSKPWRNGRALKYINDYDNTILYTDTVLSDLINETKTIQNSCFLYFSDHGEEVFDTLPQHGHVHELRSRHYIDIPFLIWISPNYKDILGDRVNLWRASQNKPFMNDIAANIMAELAGIHLPDRISSSRNPLSLSYKPEDRMPYGINYDKVYNGTNGIDEPIR